MRTSWREHATITLRIHSSTQTDISRVCVMYQASALVEGSASVALAAAFVTTALSDPTSAAAVAATARAAATDLAAAALTSAYKP